MYGQSSDFNSIVFIIYYYIHAIFINFNLIPNLNYEFEYE